MLIRTSSTLLSLLVTAIHVQAQQHDAKRLPDGREVTAPVLISSSDPACPATHVFPLRRKVVGVYLIVPETGVPQGVKIVRSGGEAYDAKALEAVERYRFKPAAIKGDPVKVDLYVDVNFRC